MKQELQEKIFEAAPKLYRDRHLGPQKSLMAFGFEVGDGWFQLIYDLSVKLELLHTEAIPVTAIQVKEKYGGLRFYVGEATDAMHALIDKAEKDSYKICEVCGADGKPTEGAWVHTLCEACKR